MFKLTLSQNFLVHGSTCLFPSLKFLPFDLKPIPSTITLILSYHTCSSSHLVLQFLLLPFTLMSSTLQCLHHSEQAVSMENNYGYGITRVSEIEEEFESENSSQFHFNDGNNIPMATISEKEEQEEEEDTVYVAVGKSDSSMEALSWTLNHLASPSSTTLFLIHVFPEIKHIPNPFKIQMLLINQCPHVSYCFVNNSVGVGMVPKNQVSSEQVETYMAQERGKRRELLHKFLQSCSASKVKVETILIESDLIAKAIIDLIPILQIRKLVIGANKSQLRKSKSRKGNGIADQILQNAPESCKVRIICEGKEVNEQITRAIANDSSISQKHKHHPNGSVSCVCFSF